MSILYNPFVEVSPVSLNKAAGSELCMEIRLWYSHVPESLFRIRWNCVVGLQYAEVGLCGSDRFQLIESANVVLHHSEHLIETKIAV